MLLDIKIKVSSEDISNLFVSVMHGGYTTWIESIDQVTGLTPEQAPWYGEDYIFEEGLSFRVIYDDPDYEEGTFNGDKIFTFEDIKRGLEVMATEFSDHFADIIYGNDDAITADVFMQCVVFNDVIYG